MANKNIERVSGFYIVHKYASFRENDNAVAEWSFKGQCWYLCGTSAKFDDDYFFNINEKRIKL